jgi:hypothetical protein
MYSVIGMGLARLTGRAAFRTGQIVHADNQWSLPEWDATASEDWIAPPLAAPPVVVAPTKWPLTRASRWGIGVLTSVPLLLIVLAASGVGIHAEADYSDDGSYQVVGHSHGANVALWIVGLLMLSLIGRLMMWIKGPSERRDRARRQWRTDVEMPLRDYLARNSSTVHVPFALPVKPAFGLLYRGVKGMHGVAAPYEAARVAGDATKVAKRHKDSNEAAARRTADKSVRDPQLARRSVEYYKTLVQEYDLALAAAPKPSAIHPITRWRVARAVEVGVIQRELTAAALREAVSAELRYAPAP